MSSCNINAGDTVWVLLSSILVLSMIPSLAIFEIGLLRAKHAVNVFTQIFAGTVVLSIMWFLFGYSLSFGKDKGGVIGSLDNAFLMGVEFNSCTPDYAVGVPGALFAFFTMMFAVITPLLLTGGYAERLKFSSFMMITCLWEILVFYPLAHQIWGINAWAQQIGILDYSGGLVIHTSAGVSSFVISYLVGKRKKFDENHGEFQPSNLIVAGFGAGLLLFGWYGFNAGTAMAADQHAVSTVFVTHMGASAAAVTWLALSAFYNKPSFVSMINGAVAGLAGITGGSGYVDLRSALIIGLVVGVFSFHACFVVKKRLQIDDALDVSSVHGISGIVGSLAIGFCATQSIFPVPLNGVLYGGNGKLLGLQLLGVVFVVIYAGGMSYVITKFTEICVGLRVSPKEEDEGLDISCHGEIAYHALTPETDEKSITTVELTVNQ